MFNPFSAQHLGDAAANVYDKLTGRGLADLRPTPRVIITEERQRTVYRYLSPDARPASELPTLLVPPLAASADCFDLHRDCSLAGHLLSEGHATYLLDYGDIGWGERDLGIEHWIDEVLPFAVENVARDAGVQLVGWSLGGILALLAVAAHQELAVRTVTVIGSPFDVRNMPLVRLVAPIADVSGGALGIALFRAAGGVPAPLTKRAFQLTSWDKYLTKPAAVLANLHDREALAQMEAVDHFIDNMLGYPGRSIIQLYQSVFGDDELSHGRLTLGGRTIDLADVRQPVLAFGSDADVLAPAPVVFHVADLLTGASEVRLRKVPGGHLGMLAGRSAVGTTWVELDRFLRDHGTPSPPLTQSTAAH
jgi:polyhydroxyalkanoate synthase